MDGVVTYGAAQNEVVELKVCRGEEYHQRGLGQLADHFDIQSLDHGFLLVFDFGKGKEYKKRHLQDGCGKYFKPIWWFLLDHHWFAL